MRIRPLELVGIKSVFEQDAIESFDFLQSILEILYHLRPKFNRMLEQKEKSCKMITGFIF
jgi:hypothetical protein